MVVLLYLSLVVTSWELLPGENPGVESREKNSSSGFQFGSRGQETCHILCEDKRLNNRTICDLMQWDAALV